MCMAPSRWDFRFRRRSGSGRRRSGRSTLRSGGGISRQRRVRKIVQVMPVTTHAQWVFPRNRRKVLSISWGGKRAYRQCKRGCRLNSLACWACRRKQRINQDAQQSGCQPCQRRCLLARRRCSLGIQQDAHRSQIWPGHLHSITPPPCMGGYRNLRPRLQQSY